MRNYPGSTHNHTEYSNARLRDCIIKIKDLLARAQELGHTVVGVTEHDFVGGWIELEEAKAKYPEIKVIFGNEIYLCRNGLNADNFNREKDRYYHFCLYAKDLEGAKQIYEISTRAWLRSYKSYGMRRVPTYYQDLFDIIGTNPGHIMASTACLGGALPTQILRGTSDELLERWLHQMVGLFGGDNFFLEMQPNQNKDQVAVNKKLLEFARKFNLRFIITTDSHYLKKEDRPIHKAFLTAQNGDREVDDFYETTYMMETDEICKYIDYFDEEVLDEAFSNIEFLANSCEEFTLKKPLKIPSLLWRPLLKEEYNISEWYSKIPMLRIFAESPHKSDQYLVKAIIDGIEQHKDLQNKEAYDELNENLDRTWQSSEVNKARWSAYFLNLQRNIDECWNAGTIVMPARGSGGGFLLLYCLDIIQMNKMRENAPLVSWRFLNPERVSVLDIDTDIEGSKRAQVLQRFREVYGQDRVANVATFRTEKGKMAILTAARGLGINDDEAQYIASLVPADRGIIRSLHQCMYGDEESGYAPIKPFVFEMTENHPELWEVASRIEGLINGTGVHSGGVIFVDEPFNESTALMRAPDGTVCTQYDLSSCEKASLIKIDLLSVEAADKIHNCIDLLCEQGYVERKPTLRETYESVIGVYNIERTNPEMWEMVYNHKINSLFQMEQQSGVQGIALTRPKSIEELAVLNSVIRLMAPEKGAEQPLSKFARFKKNPELWYREMDSYGLTKDEQKLLEPILKDSFGICEAQERFMLLVQIPECGGFSLTWSDRLRKAIAKFLAS